MNTPICTAWSTTSLYNGTEMTPARTDHHLPFTGDGPGARPNPFAATSPPVKITAELGHLHGAGDTLTPADTQCSQAAVGTAFFHFIEQGHKDAGAAGTDGMTQGDSTTVNINN